MLVKLLFVLTIHSVPDKKPYSLCDAASFVVMRERSIAEALTTDKHFEQEWTRETTAVNTSLHKKFNCCPSN